MKASLKTFLTLVPQYLAFGKGWKTGFFRHWESGKSVTFTNALPGEQNFV